MELAVETLPDFSRAPAYPIVLFGPLSLLSVIEALVRYCGVRSLTGVSCRVRIWRGAFTGLESIAGLQAAVCETCPAAALSRVLTRHPAANLTRRAILFSLPSRCLPHERVMPLIDHAQPIAGTAPLTRSSILPRAVAMRVGWNSP
jgi:hypothetical protein